MERYVTAGQIQSTLIEHFTKTGTCLHFVEALQTLCMTDATSVVKPRPPLKNNLTESGDEFFAKLLPMLTIPVSKYLTKSCPGTVNEADMLPKEHSVMVFKHFAYIYNRVHSHDFFEINYILRGECLLIFEEEIRRLKIGECCIIAPNSPHDIKVGNVDTIVISILLRRSTFDTTFFELLTKQDLLSGFFNNHLYGKSMPNYLLFFTDDRSDINIIMKNLLLENYRDDPYADACCVNWMKLLFANILRKYTSSVQFNYYRRNSNYNVNMPYILQYIQSNFKTITLESLATFFHYTETYLSKLIKKHTGHTFMELLTDIRMAAAMEYIEHTGYKVSEIAESVGYNSVDHFSRTFKKRFGVSPKSYMLYKE